MCTSLTGAVTTTGVSTSSTPRAAKNSRVHARSAARRSRSAREAPGRQSPPPLTSASREPGERLAHPRAAARGERAQPLAPALRQQQYDRGAHVEAAELGAFLELERRAALIERQLGAMAQAPRRHLAVPQDRKSTRLNSSHRCISYAVFCLKKKSKLKHLFHQAQVPRSVVLHEDGRAAHNTR